MKQRSVDEVLNKLEYNIVNSFFKDKIPFKKTTKSEFFQILKRELEKEKKDIYGADFPDGILREMSFVNNSIDKSIQVIAKLLEVDNV